MKLSCFYVLFVAAWASLSAEEVPKGFKAQELAPLGGELIMPESWYYRGGMTKDGAGFMFVASKEKNEDGHYETGMRIQGRIGVKKVAGISASEACRMNLEASRKRARKVIRTWPELEFGLFKRIGIEVLQPNPKNSNDDYHIVYSFYWNDEMDMMNASVFGAPESTWMEAEKIYFVMSRFRLIDMKKIKFEGKAEHTPEKTMTESETPAFDIGSFDLGYMSQGEFAQRIETDEFVAYTERIKTKCEKFFEADKVPKQLNIVVVVHQGHSHVWIVDAKGSVVPSTEELVGQLAALALPRLKKEPVVFAIDARVAGGKPASEDDVRRPIIPEEWSQALQKTKSDNALHIDDVIRLVCTKS